MGIFPPWHRTEQKLTEPVARAAPDVTADQVGIVLFERGRRQHVAMEDQIAEAGREALELTLDPIGHVNGRTVRDVNIRPSRSAARPAPASGSN